MSALSTTPALSPLSSAIDVDHILFRDNDYDDNDTDNDSRILSAAISIPFDDHLAIANPDRRQLGRLQIGSRYDHFHSLLITGSIWRGKEDTQTVLGVSLPETAASLSRPITVPRRVRSRRFPGHQEQFNLRGPCRAMAADVLGNVEFGAAPSSPPELSYSKSSKSSSSSSYRSSSPSDHGSTEKLSHFEDITLEEAGRGSGEDNNLKPESRPTLRRPPRAPTTNEGFAQRELRLRPNGAIAGDSGGSRYPSLQTLNLPNGRTMRRGFTSPSSPSLMAYGPDRMISRSPSPNKPFMHNGVSVSPSSLASATPRAGSTMNLPTPLSRRGSWQPTRKSAKELEDEYHDSDEDVPDGAILENVPISPMPGMPRISSREPSPQRRPSYGNVQAYSNLHSAKVPRHAKRPSAPPMPGQLRSPRSPNMPRPPMMPHSATVSSFPPGQFHGPTRSKSWTADLNDEAKQLSAALEEYADRVSTDKHGSGLNSASSSPPRPSFSSVHRTKSTIIELPPVQKGNIMIDPLPISKEKEAVLARTRPSWLPPKCRKEEKKHVKEWEQMMARAAEAEKKKARKERTAQESRQEMQGNMALIWEQQVLPDWDAVIREPSTRELWWRGINPSSRGVVWAKAIGNDLSLSEASFDAALARARTLEDKLAALPAEERSKSKESAWLDAIARDVPTVFPELDVFNNAQNPSLGQRTLSDVLKAYALYRSDVGYVFGTHLIAGLLCLSLRPADAFVALANLLNRPTSLAFLIHDQPAMARVYDLVLATLRYKSARLHAHLVDPLLNLSPADYLDPIFRCLFAYNLPAPIVSRIWDIFVFEGDKTLVRAAVAVLMKLESSLYGSREEILNVVSWRNERRWDVGGEEDFIAAVREAGKVDAPEASPSS